MNKEQLIFTMFKDEKIKCRKHLKTMIKNQFKDVTEEELKDITLKIYNYQVDKYGAVLLQFPESRTIDELNTIQKRDRQRKYSKEKYYRDRGRR